MLMMVNATVVASINKLGTVSSLCQLTREMFSWTETHMIVNYKIYPRQAKHYHHSQIILLILEY